MIAATRKCSVEHRLDRLAVFGSDNAAITADDD
jgi:hypothetical protein